MLALAAVVLLAYVVFLVATVWLFVSAFDAFTARESGQVDVVGIAR